MQEGVASFPQLLIKPLLTDAFVQTSCCGFSCFYDGFGVCGFYVVSAGP